MDNDFYDPEFALKSSDTRVKAAPYDPSIVQYYRSLDRPQERSVKVKAFTASGGIKPLRDLCAVVVAGLIDQVESLANIPWPLARLIYTHIQTPTATTVSLFAADFPTEFTRFNTHLVIRNAKLSKHVREQLAVGWFGFFLKSLDLSGTDVGDDGCVGISKLEVLELLDLSSTSITNTGLRTLSRPMLYSSTNPTTGLPTTGLKHLAFLNLSACASLTPKDLDDLLSRFPSLLVLGLSRTYVQRMGVVDKLKTKRGWVEVAKRVNVFPSFRGGIRSMALDAEKAKKAARPEPTAAADSSPPSSTTGSARPVEFNVSTQHGIQHITAPDDFFGTLSHSAAQNLKNQRDEYFQCRAYALDEEISRCACAAMEPEYRRVVESAWKLLHLAPEEEHEPGWDSNLGPSTADSAAEKLPPFNDLYESVVGPKALPKHGSMAPWYLPFNIKTFSWDESSQNDRTVKEIVDSEIHGRLCLVRSEARRDLELRRVVEATRAAKEVAKPQGVDPCLTPGVAKKEAERVTRCLKRLEPSPKVVAMSKSSKKVKVGLTDFNDFLNLEMTSGSGSGAVSPSSRSLSRGLVAKPEVGKAKSGLFKMLSKR
ncbi:hypothetical protein HDU98_003586 [Podochytrium sp. JEL0797]|nr:hypothetical protein HDU98_003586 [Podochytrium sp. JEL0797]